MTLSEILDYIQGTREADEYGVMTLGTTGHEKAIAAITAEIKAAIPEKRGAEATLNVAEDLKANYNFGYNTAIDELTASIEERLGIKIV